MKLFAVIIFVVVVIVILVTAASFIVGGIDQAVSAPPPDQTSSDPCVDCNNYNNWYNGLQSWRQNVEYGFYLARRADCTLRGCPFKP
jgi:hypothetical protein